MVVAQPECSGAASSYGAMHHNTVHKNWKVCLRAESTASNNAAARLAVEKLSPKTKEFLDSTPAFHVFDFSQLEPSKASVIQSERKWHRSSSLWSIIPGRCNNQLREILSVPNGLCQRCSTFPFFTELPNGEESLPFSAVRDTPVVWLGFPLVGTLCAPVATFLQISNRAHH